MGCGWPDWSKSVPSVKPFRIKFARIVEEDLAKKHRGQVEIEECAEVRPSIRRKCRRTGSARRSYRVAEDDRIVEMWEVPRSKTQRRRRRRRRTRG